MNFALRPWLASCSIIILSFYPQIVSGGMTQSEVQAAKGFLEQAKLGDKVAQYNLGISYANGLGVIKDLSLAVAWWKRSADQGLAEAQHNLGTCYHMGNGVTKDDDISATWYRKAAEQGNAHGQYALGNCYMNGHGVPKELSQATKLFRMAADQGHAEAQYNLGLCYANGTGLEIDMVKAASWYLKAAEQGEPKAQFHLGVCYGDGAGVEKNEIECYAFVNLSLKKDADQRRALAVMELNMKMSPEVRVLVQKRVSQLQKEIDARISKKQAEARK